MRTRSLILVLFLAQIVSVVGEAQLKDVEKPASSAPDVSKEAFVIDQSFTRIVAESDGTALREQKAAVRILADAGVKQFAVLNFAYTSANETVDLAYVRVRKPDGTIINTPDYNIQDMPADVTRSAPMYSDIHEKHVAVKGLGVGDVLEYDVRYRVVKPQIPDQFWFDYSFTQKVIVKDERLELDVPSQKRVTVSSPTLKPEIKEDGSRRIYRWASSVLEPKQQDGDETAKKDADRPSVEITTFASWEEVGRWYAGLQQEQLAVTPAIRSKSMELVKGLTTDDEKIRAIYNYVALRIHYVGLSFGIGRYQPHAADDVLGNEYGDCKDKHTLLASLLKAAGFEAWPALINSSKKIDPEVPSPSQVDHVITVLPQGDKLTWLDSTPEVAPFGLILPNLRDKRALVIPTTKAPFLIKTPLDPPFSAVQTLTTEGKLTSDGTFSAHFEQSFRGDSEVILRSAFRQVPQAQWKDLMQGISYRSGFGGDVSGLKASAVDDTTQPFQISYEYLRKKYSDWENRRITPPLPPLGIEVANDANEKKPSEPLFLGAPGEIVYRSKIQLPEGSSVTPPKNLDLVRPYAEYHTTNSFENGVLTSVRRFVIRNREVAVSEWEDYRKFRKAVADDEWQFINLSGVSAESKSDDNKDAEVESIFREGTDALTRRDLKRAQEAFERVLDKDPKCSGAHYNLGMIFAQQGRTSEAVSEFRLEQEISPNDARAYAAAASLLVFMQSPDQALKEYRKLLKIDPRNIDAALKANQLLMNSEKYAEAASVLEDVVKQSPESPSLRLALGSAYMKAGQKEKGVTQLREAVEGKSTPKEIDPDRLNKVAYLLADNKVELELAKGYAEKAVAELESRSVKNAEDDDIALPLAGQLATIWDTLGWIYFQSGDLTRAQDLIRASWLLSQSSGVGDHLGQIYERQGKKNQAEHIYQLALVGGNMLRISLPGTESSQSLQADIGARYEAIRAARYKLAGNAPTLEIRRLPNGEWTPTPEEELSRMRKTRIVSPTAPSGSAEFSIVFSPAKVEAVRYVSGDSAVKSMAQKLATAKYGMVFPAGSAAIVVRRATIVCSRSSGCDVVLHLPESTNIPVFLPPDAQ